MTEISSSVEVFQTGLPLHCWPNYFKFMKKHLKRTLSQFVLVIFSISSTALAGEESSLFSNLDYPELQVAPRASERLSQLAALEDDQGLLMYWTTMSSGLATFIAGATHSGKNKDNTTTQEKEDSKYAATTAMSVGAVWMGIGGYFSYKRWAASRLQDVRKINGKDKRSDLARERMAEEAMAFASDNLKTLKYLSVATNLMASAYVANYTPRENQIYSSIAIGLSFLPLLFDNPYETAWEKQQEYKKKIYAPLVSWNIDKDRQPQLSLLWQF